MADQSSYDSLDTPMLTNLLLSPEQRPEVHKGALSALSRRSPAQRTSQLIRVLKNIADFPERYNQDVMMLVIDLLATDPDPDATLAMLEMLPRVLEIAIENKDALKPEFREYYYTALVSRQRDSDLNVWREMLPTLEPKTLVAALVDPVAEPLQAIEPLTLIDRLPEPQRSKALFSAIAGMAHTKRPVEQILEAARLLSQSHDPAQLEQGIEALAQRWERAKKSNAEAQAACLEAALQILDTRPRTAAEKLIGKRPWAS